MTSFLSPLPPVKLEDVQAATTTKNQPKAAKQQHKARPPRQPAGPSCPSCRVDEMFLLAVGAIRLLTPAPGNCHPFIFFQKTETEQKVVITRTTRNKKKYVSTIVGLGTFGTDGC